MPLMRIGLRDRQSLILDVIAHQDVGDAQQLMARRDDGFLTTLDQRHQIAEGLAAARTGLDEDVALGLERLGDGLRHSDLLRARLVARELRDDLFDCGAGRRHGRLGPRVG